MVLLTTLIRIILPFSLMLTEAVGRIPTTCQILSCEYPLEHTMCKYPKPSIDTSKPKCNGPKIRYGLSQKQKDFILKEHNTLRNKVALGKHQNQPKASNLVMLRWDPIAEVIAQRWANQCEYAHDKCRDIRVDENHFLHVGQNTAMGVYKLKKPNVLESLKKAIHLWFKEGDALDAADINKFTSVYGKQGKSVGHYTQLVWANVTAIGCGLIAYNPNEKWNEQAFILHCNYVPAGNVIGAQVYKIGDPQSNCPYKKSDEFPGLCVEKVKPHSESDGLLEIKGATTKRPHLSFPL